MPERICGALAAVRAVAVSAGCEHSLVLAAGGAVYSFGYGSHGRLGHGDEEARCNATPARPPFPAPPRAPPPSATSPPEHGRAADCTRGELTEGSSLGANQCRGRFEARGRRRCPPALAQERLEPQPIASLGGGRTVGAGQYGLAAYSVASTASGDALAFGCGEDDALGVGARSENLLRPRRYPHLRLAGEGRTEESPRECC